MKFEINLFPHPKIGGGGGSERINLEIWTIIHISNKCMNFFNEIR